MPSNKIIQIKGLKKTFKTTIHALSGVDLEIIWQVIQDDLPLLLDAAAELYELSKK